MKRVFICKIALFLCFALTTCVGEEDIGGVKVTSVTLDLTALNLSVGSSGALIVTILPENAANKKVIWESSNPSVATVSSSGIVTAISTGTATITVRTESGGKIASCTVTVTIAVTGVSLNKNAATLAIGGTEQLTATVQPQNASNKNVTWNSSNTAIASVSSNGLVTALAAGTATITVRTVDGNKTATCTITTPVAVTGVTLNKTTTSLTAGSTEQLMPTIQPTNATNKNVTWESSNTNVATVNSNGLVTAKAVGTATITVRTSDSNKTAICTVTVTAATISVTGVTLNKTSTSLEVGKTEQLTATIQPANATNKNITWSSNNNNVATVNSNGLISAVAAGNATITVTTQDGNKTATCNVTVTTPTVAVTGVTLNKTTTSIIYVGGTEQLTPTVQPTNATNKSVTWSSSNNNIATVNSNGLVTAVAAGTAIITVRTNDGNKTDNCFVTVTIAVTGVSLNKTSTSLNVGSTEQLTATIQPTNAINKNLTWSSSNNNIATVSSSGLVTAVADGTATITVRTTDGGKTATCSVTVKLSIAEVNVPTAGALNKIITEQGLRDVTHIKITGVLNDVDFTTLRSMQKLIYVDISDVNITILPTGAFQLKYITNTIILPKSLVEIGSNALAGCSSITSIIIPANVQTIGSGAFYNCTKLISITIPANVQTIGSETFKGCSSLTSIIIPANVQTIGSEIFRGCASLTSITIPANIQTIGNNAFYNCTSLASVIFENGSKLTTIENGAFYGCSSMTSIIIPANVQIIKSGTPSGSIMASGVFFNCTTLTKVAFENGSKLTSIGSGAFYNCTKLTSITIPANVQTIEHRTFYNCTSLPTVVFENGSKLTSIGNDAYYGSFAFYGCSSLTSITIPANVQTIGSETFRGCASLATVIFENGSKLTTIGGNIFMDCKNLTSITIPANVQSIGGGAYSVTGGIVVMTSGVFFNCTSLSTVVFENGSKLTTIGRGAFFNCTKLKTVDASKCTMLKSISAYAFYHAPIELFRLGVTTPPTLEILNTNSYFDLISNVAILEVPDSSITLYQSSSWAARFRYIIGLS